MVEENRQLVADALGCSTCIYLNQIHSDRVLVLQGARDKHTLDAAGVQTADAMVTDIPDLALVIQVADCQPVLLVDPVKKVVANIHSGWKGSISNIIGKCVDAMHDTFGSDPGDILAESGRPWGPAVLNLSTIPRRSRPTSGHIRTKKIILTSGASARTNSRQKGSHPKTSPWPASVPDVLQMPFFLTGTTTPRAGLLPSSSSGESVGCPLKTTMERKTMKQQDVCLTEKVKAAG